MTLTNELLNDEKGTAGVEFALTVPVLLVLFIGAVELSGYMEVSRRAEMANNSVAQVLSVKGQGGAAAMHYAWHIPSQINSGANYGWNYGDRARSGEDWRNPFAFSQIVYTQSCPSCQPQAKRDFMFAFGLPRGCNVNILEAGKKPEDISDLPYLINQRAKPVMMVAHTAQYKPVITARFLPLTRAGTINITKVSYAVRHDGALWNYPPNAHPMYRRCGGPT